MEERQREGGGQRGGEVEWMGGGNKGDSLGGAVGRLSRARRLKRQPGLEEVCGGCRAATAGGSSSNTSGSEQQDLLLDHRQPVKRPRRAPVPARGQSELGRHQPESRFQRRENEPLSLH